MNFDRPVLAFDTALNGCAVCVYHAEGAEIRLFETEREQAARLVPLIQEAMESCGVSFSDLGLIVTSIGPGSFTGLRISLSTARAFGLSLGIPVHGLNSMAVMAASCSIEGDKADKLVLLETKRSDYYAQLYSPMGEPLNGPACLTFDSAFALYNDGLVLCGDAVERFAEEAAGRAPMDPAKRRPRRLLDPATLARMGLLDYERQGGRVSKPEPLYLRGADVSVSNKIQRIIEEMPL